MPDCMAHKTMHLHPSSMRKTAFKPIYSKKIFGCAEDLVRDGDDSAEEMEWMAPFGICSKSRSWSPRQGA